MWICVIHRDLSFYEDEYSSFYGPNGGSYDRGAAAEYEKQDAEGQEEEDTRVVHVFDFGDPIAERIAQLQKCCDVDLLPTDKGSCFPSGPLQGVSGTEHDTANSFGVLSVGPMTRLIFGAIFLARALLTSIT